MAVVPNTKDAVLKGIAITIAGGYGLYWVYNQPCNIAPNPMIGLTQEMTRLMCLSVDLKLTLIMIVASAALFAGITKVVQNL